MYVSFSSPLLMTYKAVTHRLSTYRKIVVITPHFRRPLSPHPHSLSRSLPLTLTYSTYFSFSPTHLPAYLHALFTPPRPVNNLACFPDGDSSSPAASPTTCSPAGYPRRQATRRVCLHLSSRLPELGSVLSSPCFWPATVVVVTCCYLGFLPF